MSVAGNIEAIRDWGNRFFYTKEEVAEFFIKSNDNFLAYKIDINGVAETEYTIYEDTPSDPQSYTFTTNEEGKYSGLFFFKNDTLRISINGTYYILSSSYRQTINII